MAVTVAQKRHPVEAAYPLSPLQHGMLFHSVAESGRDPYLRQDRYLLEGELDVAALAGAWRAVAAAHPVLRTAIVWRGLDSPLQVVAREATIELRVEEGGDDELAARDRALGFDLARPPLLRATLVRRGEREHVLVVTFHHIVLDGWSLPLVLGDVFLAYAQLVAGRDPALPARRPFKDFVAWLGRQPLADAYGHWERRLDGVTEPTPLPGRLPSSGPERRRVLALELDDDEAADVAALARRERVTEATQLHGAWAIVLAAHAGAGDVVFGTTVSGRPDELDGVEEMTGLFINTLPARVALPRAASVAEWLRGLQDALAEDRRHGHVSLGEIARRASLPPGQRLLESLVVFENAPVLLPPELDRYRDVLRVTGVRGEDTSSLPLVLLGLPGERLRLELHVDAGKVDAAAAAVLLERVRATLVEAARRPEAAIGELLGVARSPIAATHAAAPERAQGEDGVAPRTDAERQLVHVFARTLGLDEVGVHDDFFELGGDSLLALRLVARARESGLAIELRELLQRPTVAGLATVARPVAHSVDGGFDGGLDGAQDGDEDVPLSPMQRRYLEQAGDDPALFDQVEGLEFDVALDPERVEAALRALAVRHPALRTRFVREDGAWRQRVVAARDDALTFETISLTELTPAEAEARAAERARELRATADLAAGPPWSTLLLLLPGGQSRVVVAVNHLVFDPYSWGVLLTELARAIFLGTGALESEAPPPFAAWTRHLASLARGTTAEEVASFWRHEVAGASPGCPVDFERGENDVGSTAMLETSLPEDATAALSSSRGVDARLAAALARAFARWAGTPGGYLLVEWSGRDVAPTGSDMSRTVGWFTCLAPAWIPVGDETPAETIRCAAQALARTRANRIAWDLLRDRLGGLPQPAIALNYLGQADRERHAPPPGISVTPLYGPAADWDVLTGRIDPTLRRDVLLDVEAVSVAGRLSVNFVYSTNRHRHESVAALADAFHDELLAGLPKLETLA